MSNILKRKIAVKLLFILILIFIFIVTIYLFPIIVNLSTEEGQVAFKEMVSDYGFWGFIILFLLQLAQVVIAVLPGEPMEVLAGMCYGALWGTLFIMVSNLIITMIIFLSVKKYGKRFIYYFFDSKRIDRILNSKVFKNTKKVELILLFLFFLPGTPKDLLIYIGGMLPLDPLRFILIATLARFPSIISSTIVGTNLVMGKWQFCILIYLITFIFTGILYLFLNRFDKNKVTSKAMKILK